MKRRTAALTAIAAATISMVPITAAAAAGATSHPADAPGVVQVERGSGGPDYACLKAGVRTLVRADLLAGVAKNGLPIADAVALGVAPRPGTDLSRVPDPLPLSVILLDHLRGDRSLFIYPWCS